MFYMPGKSYRGPFLPLSQVEVEIKHQLTTHITELAGRIGERNIWHYYQLQAAANYIDHTFKKNGYVTSAQIYQVDRDAPVKNIIAEKRGTTLPDEIIIIGAHYDTVIGSPGADDNASGVAAMLEIARLLVNTPTKRTIRFIAFVNEEPPFFYTKKMGSYQYAHDAKMKGEKIVAMLSLESIGYYSEQKHSQQYPFPFMFFFPNTADFIGFVANLSSRQLVQNSIASFREHVKFPSEGIAAPSWVMGVGWSDQWAFWRHGFQAIMITGTALFRNPYYHTEDDKPETIDYHHTARVVNGIRYVVNDLANK